MSRTALAGFPRSALVHRGNPPVDLGVHPSIAANAGPGITIMREYDGVILLGYGDWGSNTGPIDIVGIDSEGTPYVFLSDFATEAVSTIRVLDGDVWIPPIDNIGAATGVVTNWGGTWHVMPVPDMQHLFDVSTLDGTDIWLAGTGITSQGTIGPMVIRTASRTAPSWETVYEYPNSASRVYTLWPSLVAGKMVFGSEADSTAWSWDSTAGLTAGVSGYSATDLVAFPGNHWLWGGGIATIKGVMGSTGFIAANPMNIRPDASVAGVLYGVKSGSNYVYKATGIDAGEIDWQPLLRVPHEARALASDGTYLYVGGLQGQVTRAPL